MPRSTRKTVRFLLQHPIGAAKPASTLWRFAAWQFRSRFRNEVIFDWIDGARLVVRNGMTGATGNIYCGLHEYVDMTFVINLLRQTDLFIDAGANVGTYTVLASKVCGARSIAFEPDSQSYSALVRNLKENAIEHLVELQSFAVGDGEDEVQFTFGKGPRNRVATAVDSEVQWVRQTTLDRVLKDRHPTLIKLDVEGSEGRAIRGASYTLRTPSLLAVITEGRDADIELELNRAGFFRAFYFPRKRELKFEESDGCESNNAIFVRDIELCQNIIYQAEPRNVFGVAI